MLGLAYGIYHMTWNPNRKCQC